MEEVMTGVKNDTKESSFEFHNYWTQLSEMGFQLFSVDWMTTSFAFVNALSVVILNFEFRFYFKKK